MRLYCGRSFRPSFNYQRFAHGILERCSKRQKWHPGLCWFLSGEVAGAYPLEHVATFNEMRTRLDLHCAEYMEKIPNTINEAEAMAVAMAFLLFSPIAVD